MKQQIMTSMRHTRLPWTQRSNMVGLSTLLFLLPACKPGMSPWRRKLCIVQACVAYLSDFHYAGRTHLSHGIDRIVATTHVALYVFLWRHFALSGLDAVAAMCYSMSMACIRMNHRKAYELWHTLWHVAASACLWQSNA